MFLCKYIADCVVLCYFSYTSLYVCTTAHLFQDALDREYSGYPFEHKMEVATRLFASALQPMSQCAGFTSRDISLDVLEGVAKLRYALLVAAELLQFQVKEMERALASNTHIFHGRVASSLVEAARYCCMCVWCP